MELQKLPLLEENLEGQRKELKELERQGGQGRSEEWMRQMNKIKQHQVELFL